MADVKKDTKVKHNTLVQITWTKKTKYHEEGETSMVHPVQAKKFSDNGIAKITGTPVDKKQPAGRTNEPI